MLRTNLSTRPFYNDRAVRVTLGGIAVLVAALTLFNLAQILTLNDRNSVVTARAEAAESRATELRNQARATRDTLDKEAIGAVQAAAREANLLIERRAFSWTDLFNRFEETLPPDVRIVAVQPQIDKDERMLVAVTVVYRRAEDLDLFIEALEDTGAFSGVLPRQDDVQEDGMIRAVIQGYYAPPPARTTPAAVRPGAASDSSGGSPSNGQGGAPVAPGEAR